MIKVFAFDAGRVVNIRIKGRQSAIEFGNAGRHFASKFNGHEGLHVLFDWTMLEAWDNNDAASDACRHWQEAAWLIRRAAIIHEHCWNRHAAVMAAVLRVELVQVRSWSITDHPRALIWINAPCRH